MTMETPVIKQLDHAIARVDNPQPLFALLSETFQLPIAWPLCSYPSFTSGGIALGNLYLEILSCVPKRNLSSSNSSDAHFVAIAFEAVPIEESVRELDRRKIPHGPITPYVETGADGKKTKLYSNAILGKMLGSNFWIDMLILMGRLPGASAMANPGDGGALVRWGLDKVMTGNLVFFVEYAYGHFTDLPHWSEFKDHEEKRAADAAALRAQGGGALGLEAVREIIVGVKDYEKAQVNWEKLFAPLQPLAPGLWKIADGPAVRLIQHSENAIQALVFKVSDLSRAETFLREKDMLGSTPDGQIRIDPTKIHGLDIRLV